MYGRTMRVKLKTYALFIIISLPVMVMINSWIHGQVVSVFNIEENKRELQTANSKTNDGPATAVSTIRMFAVTLCGSKSLDNDPQPSTSRQENIVLFEPTTLVNDSRPATGNQTISESTNAVFSRSTGMGFYKPTCNASVSEHELGRPGEPSNTIESSFNSTNLIYSNIVNNEETNNDTEQIVNVTTMNFTIANAFVTDDVENIDDLDDHIYLVENHNFKLILERNFPDYIDFIPARWKQKYSLNSTYAERKQVFNIYYRKIENQGKVDCNKIIEKDDDAISIAKEIMSAVPRKGIPTETYTNIKDCNAFKRNRGYIDHPLSEKERNFPLAFSIIMYKDVEQAERLLRAIYRPHNYYCIHVDRKSDINIRLAVENIARCFNNVFIAKKLENVTWGEFTVLQADLNCMEELWKYNSWKYYINLTGQEFPLKTNREIVNILEAMDGANIVDGTWVRVNEKSFYRWMSAGNRPPHGIRPVKGSVHVLLNRHFVDFYLHDARALKFLEKLPLSRNDLVNEKSFYRWTSAGNRPPHGIRPVKGSVHVLVNRHFVDFCLHDARALEFLAWLRKTQIPDETYFASLNHNPHLWIKGSFLGETEAYPLKPAFMRYKNWEIGHASNSRPCYGKYVRHICILGVGDLHHAYHDIGLFVNKFHLDFEYLALDCLEEVLYKNTWEQYLEETTIDVSFYKQLDYVKYKLT